MGVETKAPEGQFGYVVVAAKRARQLMAGAPPMLDQPRSHKPTRIAMEELDLSLLEYQLPQTAEGADEKEGKRRKP